MSLESSDKQHTPLTKERARAEIKIILQNVSVMGANDRELPELERILKDLENERLTPDAAYQGALSIYERKQDYH